MRKLEQALKLLQEEWENIHDENNPYHGGVPNRKTETRLRKIIDMLKYEVSK